MENFTSSVVNGEPSWNSTPLRSVISSRRFSASCHVHSVINRGISFTSGEYCNGESNTALYSDCPPMRVFEVGSQLATSKG